MRSVSQCYSVTTHLQPFIFLQSKYVCLFYVLQYFSFSSSVHLLLYGIFHFRIFQSTFAIGGFRATAAAMKLFLNKHL